MEIAAEREGRVVPFDEVVAFCKAAVTRASALCLIEGVGGLMSPIDTRHTNLDLIVASGARPLLVAGSYLGTISHTLTALKALDAACADPIAVVVSKIRKRRLFRWLSLRSGCVRLCALRFSLWRATKVRRRL